VASMGAGVVCDGAPETLSKTIAELLRDPERRREMGRRGKEGAQAKLSWSGVAAETEDLYRYMLRTNTAPLGMAVL
jgi:glycosyltransferase involved in cell wall biosynthesis